MVSPLLTERRERLDAAPRDAAYAHIRGALHPRLTAGTVDYLVGVGRYRDAVAAAFTAVEDAVRQLARLVASPIATDLVATAFAPDSGPLADRAASAGRQQAMQRLFVAAFTRHSNPLAPCDAAQTLEALMLADLLLHELDTIATRLHGPTQCRFDHAEHGSAPGGS